MDTQKTETLTYFAMMHGVYCALSALERDELDNFERLNLNGGLTTSGWPGWEKYIGKPPWLSYPKPQKSVYRALPMKKRITVFRRCDFVCQQCGSQEDLTIDHIHPRKYGGADDLENLTTLCRKCNSKKGAKVIA